MEAIGQLNAALAGRYELEREIGAGGMATVFLARDLRHNRKVALKVLHPELSAVIGSERFLKEIDVTANLQHPHILPLFDSGNANGQLFYVMPFMEGETLRARLDREQQLPVADAVRIASEVADALAYAHKRNVIHRDIKPENILLQDGHALVADFGIALAVQQAGAGRLTATGLSLGTPQYMSPEQAMGERMVDARSDVYTLGAVTYEMLIGEPPFTGPTAQAIVAKVMSGAPAAPRALRKSVPEQVEAAVLHALEKLPSDRLATASEFSAALNGSVPAGTFASSAALASRSAKRRAGLPRGLALAALGIAAGAVGTWLAMRQPLAVRAHQFSIVLPDSLPFTVATDPSGTGVKSFDVAPDGRTVVYTAATTAGRRLVTVNLDNEAATPVPGSESGRSPALSPDGRSVAAVVADSEIRRFSLNDGSSAHVAGAGRWPILWLGTRMYLAGGCASVSATGGDLIVRKVAACQSDWVISEAAPIGTRTDSMLLHVQGTINIVSASSGEKRSLTVPAASGTGPGSPLNGSAPHFVAPGWLIFVQGSTLFAAPFDSRSLRLTGQPRAVLSNIRREQSGLAQLAVSTDGTLVWVEGGDGALSRFVWVSESGRVTDTVQFVPPTEVGSYSLSADGRRIAYSAVAPDRTARLMIADLDRHVVDELSYPMRIDPIGWIRHDRAIAGVLVRPGANSRNARVELAGGHIAVDTTDYLIATESVDGSTRCLAAFDYLPSGTPPLLLLVHGGAPADSVVLSRSGGTMCRFSPDGRSVLWNAPGGMFVAPTERGRPGVRVRIAPEGLEGLWSADGRTIYYRGTGAWYSVAAPGADLKPAAAPHLLFRGNFLQALASWDRARDGRLLLLAGHPLERVNRLRVITNFGQYLAEKMKQAP